MRATSVEYFDAFIKEKEIKENKVRVSGTKATRVDAKTGSDTEKRRTSNISTFYKTSKYSTLL